MAERSARAPVNGFHTSIHDEANKCFARMLVNTCERLEALEEEWLLSSHFERAWESVDVAALRHDVWSKVSTSLKAKET